MSFNIGLSGINAASKDINVTGNNIANASTVGFKESRAEFADVYTSTILGTGSKPIGSGVLTENIRQEFSQGSLSGTGNSLDMAIDGSGFFVLRDRGNTTYSRAGMFGLDKDGYVVTNNKSRLQGYMANEGGVVSGVMGDLRIIVQNQPPKLTNKVTAIYNLDARSTVLQEKGSQYVTNGVAVGQMDVGIAKSTHTILSAAGQPTSSGAPTSSKFATALGATVTHGATTISIDIGGGAQVINIPATGGAISRQAAVTNIQNAINTALGTQQIQASLTPTNHLKLSRAGYQATTGAGFSLSAIGTPFTAAFGAAGAVTAGTPGSKLFIGATPQLADFRSIPGTATTNRTKSAPPLAITTASPGTFSKLTANNNYSALDLSTATGNKLNFTIASESGSTYNINLSQASWTGEAPTSWTAVTLLEIVTQINAQITPAGAAIASASGGKLVLTSKAPATHGQYINIADAATSVNYNLGSLGFLSSNHHNSGTNPVAANNEFRLQVTSTSGHASSVVPITIPPANYSTMGDLAQAIQQQINLSIGVNGLADKVSVKAVGGQLVFTNKHLGSGENISITPGATYPGAVSLLKLDDMFSVSGQNEVDKTNSFRINLTVPAPDTGNRSGTVQIKLNEQYRSVQQLAASINRQLNQQSSDDYIGVRAEAIEIEPKVVPPQFKLQLKATKEGEASIISITDISATGKDVRAEELFGILQTNPANTGLLKQGVEGVSNEYPEQKVVLMNPKGERTNITIPKHSEANEIVAIFNKQPGVQVSAKTQLTIPINGFNSPGKAMRLVVNGQELSSASLKDMAKEITKLRETTMPGFKAEVNSAGNLVITNEIGRDIKVTMKSPTVTDSIVLQGAEGTGPVVLGGSTTANRSAALGGKVDFIFHAGYKMMEPTPAISGIFSALNKEDFKPYILKKFDPKDQNTYNKAYSMEIYDSLGNPHVLTKYFVKEPLDPNRPNDKNVWAMYVQIDGRDVGDPDPTLAFPKNLEPTRARFELYFNQDGTLDETATGKMHITNWDPKDKNGQPNGARTSKNVLEGGLPIKEPSTNSNFELSLNGSTQYGDAFGINDSSQNGYSPGRLKGLEIDSEGIIFARFTNGQAKKLGQVALARFRNPEGLTPAGDTAWVESYESGTATIGAPRTASFGKIASNKLENSNVDLSEELVGLIIAQRNFQANAKTISTNDKITQTILNI